MITQAVLSIIFGSLGFIIGLFNLPAMPGTVVSAISGILGFIEKPMGVARVYVGEQFIQAIFVLVLAYFLFYPALHVFVWLFNKVRGSGGAGI